MKMATGYYLNVYEDSIYGNTLKDIFIVFNEANSKPTIEELEEIKALVESELKKDPKGINLRQEIEDMDLPCVHCGVQVISPINNSLSISQKASDIIDKNPMLAREIYEQKKMEYAMEDITARIEGYLEDMNVDALPVDEIKKIAQVFHDTLGANDTFWDVYWESADYAIEEHLKEREGNILLEGQVNKNGIYAIVGYDKDYDLYEILETSDDLEGLKVRGETLFNYQLNSDALRSKKTNEPFDWFEICNTEEADYPAHYYWASYDTSSKLTSLGNDLDEKIAAADYIRKEESQMPDKDGSRVTQETNKREGRII